MNKVILMGRLTSDPELRQTNSGLSLCNFSIAVNRRFNKDETDFFNCVAWRQTAEFISKYFIKGQQILLIGELNNESFTDKCGNKRTVTKVVVDEVNFCGSKSEGGANQSTPTKTADEVLAELKDFEELGEDDDDKTPF